MKLIKLHRNKKAEHWIEPLEQRRLLSATVTAQIPSQSLGSGPVTIDLSQYFEDSIIPAGDQVVNIQTDLPAPNNNIPVDLTASAAPQTVASFMQYVTSGAYDDTVIDNSVAGTSLEGGLYNIDGSAVASTGTIPDESGSETLTNVAGTIATVLPDGPGSATSGWTFNLGNNSNPAGTIFGQVIYGGQATLNAIAALPTVNDSADNAPWTRLPVLGSYTNGSTVTSVPESDLVAINPVMVPEGLTFSVSSDTDGSVASATVAGDMLTFSPSTISGATAEFTVTATDFGGDTATDTFTVTNGSSNNEEDLGGGSFSIPWIDGTKYVETISETLVAGEAIKAHVIIPVVNISDNAATETGNYTVSVYADGQNGAPSVMLNSANVGLDLAPEKEQNVIIPIDSIPASLQTSFGSYQLVVVLTDSSGNQNIDNLYNEDGDGRLTNAGNDGSFVDGPALSHLEFFGATSYFATSEVSGGATHGHIWVDVDNAGNIPSSGSTTIQIYLTNDGSVSNATLVTSLTKQLRIGVAYTEQSELRAGTADKVLTIPITQWPVVAAGAYSVLLQITDSHGQSSTFWCGDPQYNSSVTYNFVAPSVALTPALLSPIPATLVSDAKTSAAISASITNNGNILFSGEIEVIVYVSPDGNLADATSVASTPKALKVLPGKATKVRVRLGQIPDLTAGDYFIVAEVTDPAGQATTAISSSSVSIIAG